MVTIACDRDLAETLAAMQRAGGRTLRLELMPRRGVCDMLACVHVNGTSRKCGVHAFESDRAYGRRWCLYYVKDACSCKRFRFACPHHDFRTRLLIGASSHSAMDVDNCQL